MKILRRVRTVITNLHFLLFVNGFFLAAFLFLRLQDGYEHRIFRSIAGKIAEDTQHAAEDTIIRHVMQTTHYMLSGRSQIFSGSMVSGSLEKIIHPVSEDLMTANGACGSYSATLNRIFHEMGFETRFAQMKVDGHYGGHIVTEVRARHGWVVLDPMYNLYFTRPDGQMASFAEVSANWNAYRKQVPANYNARYSYDGVRYTNWDKVPLLMPALKGILSVFMSRDALEHLSLRSYAMDEYALAADALLLLILPLSWVIIRKTLRKRRYKRKPELQRNLQHPELTRDLTISRRVSA